MPAVLSTNRYGKSRVRLMRVNKHFSSHDGSSHHDVDEWTVQILLSGDFETAHTLGDNSKILPTDTMKNTVYHVARESKAFSMEEYAVDLVDYILERNAQVSNVEVHICSAPWKRLTVDGKPYPTAFMRGSAERQTATVSRAIGEDLKIVAGLEQLSVLKTAQSGFVGYIKDPITTLPETTDRLFGTEVKATWPYKTEAILEGIDYNKARHTIRDTMISCFAKHDSLSVQQTLFAMGEEALEASELIDEIYLLMPNKHNLLVDLSRFGQTNPNHIFVPTDEPHGTIEATIRRG